MEQVRITKKPVTEVIGGLTGALMSLMLDYDTRLTALEAAQIPASSAPTTGPVGKPSRSGSVNPVVTGVRIALATSEGSKSTEYMPTVLMENWIDSSTLQLTLRWPMTFGEKLDGLRGPVHHNNSDSSSDAYLGPTLR